MNDSAQISICIPAYKNTAHLKRLLDSIRLQTFKNFEVVITDDSPDNSVETLVKLYQHELPIRYYKNEQQLGTPENWNEAVRKANGVWVKLMHNDDWFANADCLSIFHSATLENPQSKFFFSAFCNVVESTGQVTTVKCNFLDLLFLKISSLHLFKRVYIGNPSCTLIKRDIGEAYDKRFKFVVDFEYYMRCIKQDPDYKYIPHTLLNIGFHEDQVTKYTFEVPSVQIPENLLLLDLYGVKILRNPFVYDYYWRLFRNMSIKSVEQINQFWSAAVPPAVEGMITFQSRIPAKILRYGPLSKCVMTVRYLKFILFGK